MPPPTAGDSWLAGRRFGVVIDAGSSGSRLQIYSWRDASVARLEDGEAVYGSLPKVEKGAKEGQEWMSKVEPGLSSFAGHIDRIPEYLAPLLEHARSNVPPSLQSQTPLFLLATAGMRLLLPEQQAEVLSATCSFLRFHSHFRIDKPSSSGPCGSSVRIITGEEEGIFGWIAVNYLMDGFTQYDADHTTYGFLDMGGASTQIAFEPSDKAARNAENLVDVRLRLLGGKEIHHRVFVTTWLGYGTNQARERYVGLAITEHETIRKQNPPPSDSTNVGEFVPDPCLPKDLELTESPVHTGPSDSHTRAAHKLVGTGSFEQCLQRISPLLNKDAPCPDTHCLFNGVHVPPIDFSVSHFIGVSEYWYSSEHVFGLGGTYDFIQYERAASEFCGRDWAQILRQHEESREQGHLGGDGEIEHGGQVVDTGRWGAKVEISRLEMQCFKAAWIVNVLHEGIGMPRIVDLGGNGTTHGDNVKLQAGNKGLGKPTFQSVDVIDGTAISWTLGKMVHEASKEVAALSDTVPPLGDPLEDMPESSPGQPIRPPFLDFDAIEDRISHRLPTSLTRHSLGFSPLGFLFYLVVIGTIISVSYRLRNHIRASLRWIPRVFFTSRGRRNMTPDDYSMEEGKLSGSGFLPSSSRSSSPSRSTSRLLMAPIQAPLRRLASFVRTHSQSDGRMGQRLRVYSTPSSPMGNLPGPSSRSLSYSDTTYQNGGGAYLSDSLSLSDVPTFPRSSSPVGTYDDLIHPSNGSVSSIHSLSRSRNSSQMSLSTLIPRQAVSRVASGTQSPAGGTFRDEH